MSRSNKVKKDNFENLKLNNVFKAKKLKLKREMTMINQEKIFTIYIRKQLIPLIYKEISLKSQEKIK